MIKLIDYVKVLPDPSLYKLSKKEKIELIDSSIMSSSRKGLIITYDLSHSARRINNRIYSPIGQMNGIKSLLNPYAKPILQHHDGSKDPIGRFVGGKWEDLSSEAMRHFDNLGEFIKFKQEIMSDDPEKIYSAMKKHNLISNKKWPGLGRMRATAKITDKEAVEKFLDGRYITFSAGSTTNRHVCSICNSDWAKGDMCEHRHGKIYDGNVCVFITGDFRVLEGSVVNMPADDLSQIQSMELLSDGNTLIDQIKDVEIDDSYIYLSDSIIDFKEEVSMKKEETSAEETEQVLEDNETVENENTEVSEEPPAEENNLTDSVMEKIYNFIKNKQREDSNEKEKEAKSEGAEEAIENNDQKENEIKEEKASDGTEVRGVQEVSKDSEPSQEITVGDADGDLTEIPSEEKNLKNKKLENHTSLEDAEKMVDASIDWYLLDLALQTELGDAKLSSEAREKLPDSSFCGPERSFPVPDCAHVTAARRLIGRAKLSSSQKDKVIACVNKRANDMSCDSVESLEDRIERLTTFFEAQLSELKEKFENLTNDTAKEEKEVMSSDSLKVVENPSEGSSDNSSPTDNKKVNKLGSYEQKFIDNYRKILNEDGEMAAENYFIQKARYLPKGFHPKNYLN